MSLGFSIFGCSEQDGVGTYINSIKMINKFNTTINIYCKQKKKKPILTCWCGHDQLIKGEAFSSGFDNLSSGSFCESKGSDGHLWGIHTCSSDIIGDSANNNGGFSSNNELMNKYGTKFFVRTVL